MNYRGLDDLKLTETDHLQIESLTNAVTAFLEDGYIPDSAVAGIPDGITLAEAVRRKESALAQIREHELALLQGSAVEIADFETAMSTMIGAARTRLLALPMKLGPEVAQCSDAAECAELIKREIYDALTELAAGPDDIPQGKAA